MEKLLNAILQCWILVNILPLDLAVQAFQVVHHPPSLLEFLCLQEVLGHLVIHSCNSFLDILYPLLVQHHMLHIRLLCLLSGPEVLVFQVFLVVHQFLLVLLVLVVQEAREYPLGHHQELPCLLDILFLPSDQVYHLFLVSNLFLSDPETMCYNIHKKNIKPYLQPLTLLFGLFDQENLGLQDYPYPP